MQFRTKISIKKEDKLIDYNSTLLLLGSCFSENIAERLSYYKFEQLVNPFGILFHPKAIENLISRVVENEQLNESEVFFQNEIWHSFEAHSSLSNPSKEKLLQNLNTSIAQTNKQIKKATHILITLGTAWVYRLLETDTLVANCHKIPQKKFTKELLSVTAITESLTRILSLIKGYNKHATIIFTLSPVRHSKDGFIENSLSKAHLLTAIHNLKEGNNVAYFPSYELMMDELRDYRFYAEDMIHPNQTAITYIWEQFCKTWFADNALKTMKSIDSIQKGLAHKPFYPNSKQHQDFMKNIVKQIDDLQCEFPRIFFER